MNTRHAVILAAGYGSRLNPQEGHKLLATIGSRPLLEHHLANFAALKVDRVVVVTGYEAADLREAVHRFDPPGSMEVQCVHNDDFDAGNGISVLTGADALGDPAPPFWLTMSDHLFEPGLFDGLNARIGAVIDERTEGVLLIDRKLDRIFDMPDANKLRLDGEFAIGKQLDEFDAVDIGLFWCGPGFVEALRREKNARGDCSTSDAVRRLVKAGRFAFFDVGEALWQDVDTPAAREHAEKLWQQWD